MKLSLALFIKIPNSNNNVKENISSLPKEKITFHIAVSVLFLRRKMQDVLCGKNRKSRPGTKVIVPDMLPLRGFLICPNCGKMLTGSGSKGKYSVYYYYHCNSSYGCRFNAEEANERFIEELKKYAPNPAYCDLYAELLHEAYQQQTSGLSIERRQVLSQIEELTTRINITRNKAADNKFSYEDFLIVKAECTTQITNLEKQLSKLPEREKGIEGLLQKGIHNLIAIDQVYINSTIPEKRNIVSSIFPGKLIFFLTDRNIELFGSMK